LLHRGAARVLPTRIAPQFAGVGKIARGSRFFATTRQAILPTLQIIAS
jgi:hypothetical protein